MVECAGLEIRYIPQGYRGFESLPLRHTKIDLPRSILYYDFMSNWFIYILRCADGTLYTGVTTDVQRRLAEHNAGIGAKYTRSRGPLICVWQESARSRSMACKREAALKRLSRADKQKLVLTYKHV